MLLLSLVLCLGIIAMPLTTIATNTVTASGGSLYGQITNINDAHILMRNIVKQQQEKDQQEQQRSSSLLSSLSSVSGSKVRTGVSTYPQFPYLVARVVIYGSNNNNNNTMHIVAVTLTALDGSFQLHNIPIGSYGMTVTGLGIGGQFIFPLYRLDMVRESDTQQQHHYTDNTVANNNNNNNKKRSDNSKRSNNNNNKEEDNFADVQDSTTTTAIHPFLYTNEGIPVYIHGGSSAAQSAQIHFISIHQYYTPREDHSIMSFVKNPMVIMMIFTGAMMALMQLLPKEELHQQMREVTDMVSQSTEGIRQLQGGNNNNINNNNNARSQGNRR